MDRNKQILIVLGVAVVAFLLGFLPQWLRADRYRSQLDDARLELRVSRQQDAVGAALTEALRSNYERSRQLMTGFFSAGRGPRPAAGSPIDPRAARRDHHAPGARRAGIRAAADADPHQLLPRDEPRRRIRPRRHHPAAAAFRTAGRHRQSIEA
jgi:3-mercaptopyruvate sulfurtransferase SseA